MPDERRALPVLQPDASAARPPVFERIAIVGLGLMGGSLGLAARRAWPGSLLIGVDDNEVLETAMRLHAVDVAADDLVVTAEADLIVLAAPVRACIELLADLPGHVRGEGIVTDLGASKRAIVNAARDLPARLTFVGGHPLAGSTRNGIAFARADLFEGRPWVFTPTINRPAQLERLFRFSRGVGARPVLQTPEEHDRLLAYIGHLPQLVASALTQVIGEAAGEQGLALSGRGLAETTRLAASAGSVWSDVFATNHDEVGRALDALMDLLGFLRERMDSPEVIERLFESANLWRQRIPADGGRAGSSDADSSP